jgi:hypothetical protein
MPKTLIGSEARGVETPAAFIDRDVVPRLLPGVNPGIRWVSFVAWVYLQCGAHIAVADPGLLVLAAEAQEVVVVFGLDRSADGRVMK